ncbi:MAG: hypothetical protein Q8930_10930 [Bacillota bacterium]|nr:hypothetical protein [Bacillota bacterium]
MKVKAILLTMVMLTALFAGCKKSTTQPQQQPQQQTTQQSQNTTTKEAQQTNPSKQTTDTSTSASIVDNGDAFVQAISRGGTWIIAIKNDLTINKDLLVDGEFKNTKNPPVSQRKLALYAQDANRKVTARYTLTAPKMTITSPDCGLWYGTFVGDIYVSATNFQLIGATVQGNIYFTTDQAKATFKPDADSKVTGVQELRKP